MFHELRDCVALAFDPATSCYSVGSVVQAIGRSVSLEARELPPLEPGTLTKLVFRSKTGQILCDGRVTKLSGRTLSFYLEGQPVSHQGRCSFRSTDHSVSASCSFNRSTIPLKVMDISEGGMRFESECCLPVDREIRVRLLKDDQSLDVWLRVLRGEFHDETTWAGAGQFSLRSRIEGARLRQLIDLSQNLGGSIVQGLQIMGDGQFSGIVNEFRESCLTLAVRQGLHLRPGMTFLLAIRTEAGQTTATAKVAAVKDDRAALILTSPLASFALRSSPRKPVRRVKASLLLDHGVLKLQVIDVSQTGIRFQSNAPLPMDQTLTLSFSFDGLQAQGNCRIVRQDQLPDGNWVGGAKFCPQSRVEVARLKERILSAA